MPSSTRTKILATLGPASNSEEKIGELIEAGVDGFRLNFSHGTHDEHKALYDTIRRVAKSKGTHTTIVADLQGPKLRIGLFKEDKVLLKKGQKFTFDMKQELGDATRVTLPHKEIFEALKPGDTLLVNDGNIILNVLKCSKDKAETEVVVGGVISGHKGVNLPNSSLNISPLTPKDLDDLAFALELKVDCVCLSFVQRTSDVKEARKIIGKKALIISKLEKPQALDDLDGIIKASDMVMVARGDLGVECPIVTVPVLQKKIEAKCRLYGKPVIVATQMLESMISAPMPTRAEVSDVATAVYDGCDVVMLSAETAAGSYPVETVKTMRGVIEQVEADPRYFESVNRFVEDF
ncbi:MAG: pyruvate kinase, partial [Alphaproteobacteria bacterium]|nr:pyruvate kinase [Alphaproteobacteria bacterium]